MKRIFYFFIGLLGIVFIIYKSYSNTAVLSASIISPLPHSSSTITSTPTMTPMLSQSLQAVVTEAMSGSKGSYGIVVKNLKTGEQYMQQEHRLFQPGSLYKLWIMALTYQKIQAGEVDSSAMLSQDVNVLNQEFDIDPEAAELSEGTVTLSVADALEQMITISHNYAALLLSEKIKISSLNTFLKKYQFSESALGEPPVTSTADIANFLEKLYHGQLANSHYTGEMLALLKRQTLNDKLPKYLPNDIAVAHKTGEIDYFSHDAGIVYTPQGDYVIVILSQSEYPPGAEERIALVSQAIYNYFSKKI